MLRSQCSHSSYGVGRVPPVVGERLLADPVEKRLVDALDRRPDDGAAAGQSGEKARPRRSMPIRYDARIRR